MAVRKKIMKLAKKICGSTALLIKLDENAPEYYVLACTVSDEQAEVGLGMELRKPQKIEAIAKKCGKSVEETARLAKELADIGACIFHSENGVDLYELTLFVPGVLEKMVGNAELCKKHIEIPRAFEEYCRLRGEISSIKFPMGSGPMRVLPIQRSIDSGSKSLPFEEVSSILDKHRLFAVSDCSCRRSRRYLGQGCGHLEKDMCIQLGKGAEYYIRTGRARQITKEEAIEIIKKAEENGLMHSIPNFDGDETHAICNCCGCGCYSMRNANMFNAPDAVRSNYQSTVDTEKCVACGQCVENCPTNALRLGQKLCNLSPVKVPETISPRDHIWSEARWNKDYRENRKDVSEGGTAPCKTACPAHIAVQGYIKLASQGHYLEALELIKKENPFPAVCGRICPRGCESECTRGNIDAPVAIDEIKKFIADRELSETRFIPAKRFDYGKKIAVIGAGPAGLSCAYYLAVDGYKVMVFEKEEKPGGMLTLGIPSFRLKKDVVNAEIDILRELGVEFKTGVEVGRDISLERLRGEGFEAFYVAIGAQGGRKLGIEGEDASGVISGVDFLRDINLGKETGLHGKVVVIGGGNVAIDVARSAVREKTDSTQIYCLESRAEMPALEEEIEEAEAENAEIVCGWGPRRIIAENGKVTGVEFIRCISVFDGNGKFAPVYDPEDTLTVPADFVLLSVGQSIEWGGLLDGSKVELKNGSAAAADELTYQTAQPDIFVGGDCYTGPGFAIDAIAAGKQGAISIHRFVWEGQSLTAGRDRREYHMFDKNDLVIEGFDNTPRQRPLHKAQSENSFDDLRRTFTEEQMKAETQRCLECGAVVVDPEMCVGCGQCATKCKFDAIKLIRSYNANTTTFEHVPLRLPAYTIKRVVKTTARAVKDVFTAE